MLLKSFLSAAPTCLAILKDELLLECESNQKLANPHRMRSSSSKSQTFGSTAAKAARRLKVAHVPLSSV